MSNIPRKYRLVLKCVVLATALAELATKLIALWNMAINYLLRNEPQVVV